MDSPAERTKSGRTRRARAKSRNEVMLRKAAERQRAAEMQEAESLDEQLAKVNSFFAVTEAELSLSWRGLKLPRQDVVLEKTRSILSVLKTHMQRKCEAKPGQCRAYNRLKGEDNHFARFATTYEQTLTLREYTLLNYLAFSKARPAEHPFCAALSVQHALLNAAAHDGALYRCVESV